MDARRLGKTDIVVSPIGLGCWQFSQGKGMTGRIWSVLDHATMDAVVGAALKGGTTWFDTAQAYGNGASERALSAALHHLGVEPGSVAVAMKWLPILKTAGDISRTIGTRIECLQPYPIDLFQVHIPWSVSSIPAQMREMAEMASIDRISASVAKR
jgi:aryl-alcohol dehydrogenase-like predicted oxidoreductase